MVTNILEIRKILTDNKQMNQLFIEFLNRFGTESPWAHSQLLSRLSVKFSEKVDCTKCGNCCHHITIHLYGEDRRRLAKHLGMSEKDFMDMHMKKTNEGWAFYDVQCPFLQEKKCSVYAERPTVCRRFPFLNLEVMDMDGKAFMKGESILGLANRCPIVYNVFEELKVLSGFAKFASENCRSGPAGTGKGKH